MRAACASKIDKVSKALRRFTAFATNFSRSGDMSITSSQVSPVFATTHATFLQAALHWSSTCSSEGLSRKFGLEVSRLPPSS